MATENKIYVGETTIVESEITDSAGAAVTFATLTSVGVKVYDVLGNVLEPTAVLGSTTTSLRYEVDTATLREGQIKAELRLEVPNADFISGQKIDYVIQNIFILYRLES